MNNNLIAFQGVAGAHSDVACHHIHPDMNSVPYPSFEEVFEAVKSGETSLGLIPIEIHRLAGWQKFIIYYRR